MRILFGKCKPNIGHIGGDSLHNDETLVLVEVRTATRNGFLGRGCLTAVRLLPKLPSFDLAASKERERCHSAVDCCFSGPVTCLLEQFNMFFLNPFAVIMGSNRGDSADFMSIL